MSLNFTGTTGRRHINYGNRSVTGHGRASFLQNAERERARRQSIRRKEEAATSIQAAVRAYNELSQQRRRMSGNWQGDLGQFRFFFPYEVRRGIDSRCEGQLDLLDQIPIDTALEAQKTAEALVSAAQSTSGPLIDRIVDSLDRIVRTFGANGVDYSVILPVLCARADQDELSYDAVWRYCGLCTDETTSALLSDATGTQFVDLALQKEHDCARVDVLLSQVVKIPALTSNTVFLDNVVRLWFYQGEAHYSKLITPYTVQFWTDILGGVPDNSEKPSSTSQLYLSNFARNVLSTVSEDLDLFTNFLYSMLRYSPSSECQNSLIIELIVAATPMDLLNRLFDILQQDAQIFLGEDDPWDLALSTPTIFWTTLFVFAKLYSYVLSVTHDADLFTGGKLSLDNFKLFVSFLKQFVLSAVLGFKGHAKEYQGSLIFPYLNQATQMSFKLLRQIYMRNLRLKTFTESFWYLDDSSAFNTKAALPFLENPDYDTDAKQFTLGEDITSGSYQQINSALILRYLPYMVPFEQRAELFHSLIEQDKVRIGGWFAARTQGTVVRDNILFDSFDQFGTLSGDQFKRPLSVEFVNRFGEKEAGIDGGGLTKELLTSIASSAFVPSQENIDRNGGFQFFDVTSDSQLYPSAGYFLQLQYERQHPGQTRYNRESRSFVLQMLRFLGMVVGKCLYENVLIDVSFAPFFLNRWVSALNEESQRYRNSFDDLKSFDVELYHSLIKLLKFSDQDISSLDLTFTTTERLDGQVLTLSLVSGGKEMAVTRTNKLQYVYAIAKYKLDRRISVQTSHFLEGLFQVIPPHWLSLFNPYELQTLLSGGEKEIDIDDLERNVVYGGYLKDDITVRYLFEILREFSAELRTKFIKFVTSSSKQPLLGFKELNPHFGIRNSGSDRERLPTSSTCVNLLKLPDYKDKELLRRKLVYSINAEAGFDLS